MKNHAKDADGELEAQTVEQICEREADDADFFEDGWMREMIVRGRDERFLDPVEALDPKRLVFFGHQNLQIELRSALQTH